MPNRPVLVAALVLVLLPNAAEAKKNKSKNSVPMDSTGQESRSREASAESTQPRADTEVSPASASANDELAALDDDVSNAHGTDQIPGSSSGAFRMLLQLRYRSTFIDKSTLSVNSVRAEQERGTVLDQDGYSIQRAFLRYVATPSKRIGVKLLVDFAELKHGTPKQSLKLAYVEAHATKRLQFDFGLLKRPYSLLELLPIAKHELADLGPTDNFIKDQGYGGRDIGVVIRYQPLPQRRMLIVSVGAYRGDIDEGFDASPIKALGARMESRPIKHLRLGVNGVWRPRDSVKMQKSTEENSAGVSTSSYERTASVRKGAAAGTDATVSYRHLEVRAEMLFGKRTDPVRLASGRQGSFWAAWVVVAPKIELGKWLLVPALKAEVLDTDALNPGGQRRAIVGVVGLSPTNGLRILADVTRTWTDPNLVSMDSVPWTSGSNTATVSEPSWTSVTVQGQAIF